MTARNYRDRRRGSVIGGQMIDRIRRWGDKDYGAGLNLILNGGRLVAVARGYAGLG